MAVLGLDVGTTATKWVMVDDTGAILEAGVMEESLGALCQRRALSAIGLTGVGAGRISGLFSAVMVPEFAAIAKGGLALSGAKEALLVSMGTGTAFLHAKADGTFVHLCGTGIGGGTIAGLCQVMAGTTSSQEVAELSAKGYFQMVDLTMAEVTDQLPPGLLPDMTAANFARIAPDADQADYVSGAVNLVLHTVGTMALMGCQSCGCDKVVLLGGTTQLPPVAETMALFSRCYGIDYQVPDHAQYATALGAALVVLDNLKQR